MRSGAQGVGFHEARHWHRRAYGGLVDLSQIAPNELGAAAGYEAYRSWIHNSSMYEPLMPDDERQREAMVALAVAEGLSSPPYQIHHSSFTDHLGTVTRLWHSSGRRLDRYGLQVASEAAAATASIIMGQVSTSPQMNASTQSPNFRLSGARATFPVAGLPWARRTVASHNTSNTPLNNNTINTRTSPSLTPMRTTTPCTRDGRATVAGDPRLRRRLS